MVSTIDIGGHHGTRQDSPEADASAALNAEVLAACAEPGASVAAIALAHGLNTNLVHKWRRQAAGAPAVRPASDAMPTTSGSQFVALPMAATPMEIRIEIRRGTTTVELSWPLPAAADVRGLAARLLR